MHDTISSLNEPDPLWCSIYSETSDYEGTDLTPYSFFRNLVMLRKHYHLLSCKKSTALLCPGLNFFSRYRYSVEGAVGTDFCRGQTPEIGGAVPRLGKYFPLRCGLGLPCCRERIKVDRMESIGSLHPFYFTMWSNICGASDGVNSAVPCDKSRFNSHIMAVAAVATFIDSTAAFMGIETLMAFSNSRSFAFWSSW